MPRPATSLNIPLAAALFLCGACEPEGAPSEEETPTSEAEATATPTPEAPLTVRVVHPGTGEGVAGVTVVHGADLDEVAVTGADGVVSFAHHDADMPVTAVWRYDYDFPSSDAHESTSRARTVVGVEAGAEVVFTWYDRQQVADDGKGATGTVSQLQTSTDADTLCLLSRGTWGSWTQTVSGRRWRNKRTVRVNSRVYCQALFTRPLVPDGMGRNTHSKPARSAMDTCRR